MTTNADRLIQLTKREALLRRFLNGTITSGERKEYTDELRQVVESKAAITATLEIRKV